MFYANQEGGGTMLRYNLLHDSPGPAGHTGQTVTGLYLDALNTSWILHHNIVWGLPAGLMQVNGRTNFACIFNNTCANTYSGNLVSAGSNDGETGDSFFNNIFNGTPGSNVTNPSLMDQRHNLFASPGYEGGNYMPLANSAAIDAGTVIPGITGSAPDIGAQERGTADWTPNAGYKLTPPSPDPVYAMPAMDFANKVVDGSFESRAFAPNWTVVAGSNVTLINSFSWIFDRDLGDDEINALMNAGPSVLLKLSFDESAGSATAWDSSLHTRNGTLTGMNITGAWTSGIVNGALTFDGVDDRVVTSAITAPATLTVTCWARSSTSTWSTSGSLVSQRPAFVLQPQQGTANMSFVIYTDATTSVPLIRTAPPGFDITQWHHYAGVFDPAAQQMRLCVDGTVAVTLSTGGASVNAFTGGVFIGKDGAAGASFAGSVDEVRLYARALSDFELIEQSQAITSAPFILPTPFPITAPTSPAAFAVNTGAGNTLALGWTDTSSSETSFEIQRRIAGGTFATLQSVAAGTGALTDSTAMNGTTYEYRVRATNAGGSSAWTTVVAATAGGSLSSYANWMQSHTDPPITANTAPDADADFDGLPNLSEYIFGKPANAATTVDYAPGIVQINGQSYLTFTFQRRLDVTDVALTVESSGTLAAPWVSIDPLQPENQIQALPNVPAAGWQTITVRDIVPIVAGMPRFLRLRCTQK